MVGESGAIVKCKPLPWPDCSINAISVAARAAAASCQVKQCKWQTHFRKNKLYGQKSKKSKACHVMCVSNKKS